MTSSDLGGRANYFCEGNSKCVSDLDGRACSVRSSFSPRWRWRHKRSPTAPQARLCLQTVALGIAEKQALACPPAPAFLLQNDLGNLR